MHALILGGQKSGKSRCAEQRAAAWLAADGAREAVLIATATAGDDEMRDRIARHRRDRAVRLPALATQEVPIALADALAQQSARHRLVVVDCLTLWLTNLLMPVDGSVHDVAGHQAGLLRALDGAAGPVVLVSNEIGLGVSPMSAEARRFVDALGLLHQRVAERCTRVSLMVAGAELPVKGGPR